MVMEICDRALCQVISWHAAERPEKKTTKNNIQDCQCLDLNEVPSEDISKVTSTPACLIMLKALHVHPVNADLMEFAFMYVQQILELK
jgi:hypothetical protein